MESPLCPYFIRYFYECFLWIVVVNLDILSGVHSKLIYLIPVLVFGTAVGGFIYSILLKKLYPNVYDNLDQIINEA